MPLTDLVERLLSDERAAWDEFFLRFTGLLINAIRETLYFYDAYRPGRERIVWEGLVEHLLAKRAFLGRLRSAEGLSSELWKISVNFTITYLRKQSTRKGVIRELEEGATVPIDRLVTRKGDRVRPELIAWEGEPFKDDKVDIRNFFSDPISEEDYVIMKMCCVFYEPLDEKDIEAIASRRKTTPELIWAEVDELLNVLTKREEKRIKAQNQAGIERVLLWRRVAQLTKLRENALLNAERIRAVEKEVEALSKKVEQHREKANTLICPKNNEIAAILGGSLKNKANINVRLHRIRKKLAESLKGREGRRGISR
jgi:hypothetical protein